MAEMIHGRVLAQKIREQVKNQVETFAHPPGLAAIIVGTDPASRLYVHLKEEAAKEAGIFFEKLDFPEDVTTGKLVKEIKRLNDRDDIAGILVQLPLPNHDEDKVIAAINPDKDVDGFHPKNRERLTKNEPVLVPPVVLAVMQLIEATRQPLRGKKAVIIGNNPIFSEPIVHLMKDLEIDAEFVKKSDKKLTEKSSVADIIVVAVGQRNFLKPELVKDGAIIVDVGTNKSGDRVVGDITSEAKEKAGFVSPVPGGVGPLTVAYLLMNVARANELMRKKREA
ncbi:MAG: bifunctional 5,10-methylenetetrahydrofolate dehydrogenase/5,10-methenyltetrahydrofolate cyclohydrolase [Patescibacteria group bacterium]|jgi:methylenetetrahydrofolate dehydrogenase (NADP+)/methenyltetrahydrofolate cyclohydrolase